ncbi:MAG TPA: thioredoxin domain-containing protein [Cyclobacteriaceae bacterium]|nr:thioredoxin domain-containing protein [Cyclobacteriaceae bacterium]
MNTAKAMTALLITLTALINIQDSIPMQTNHNHTNRLINSTSPYLLQHAHNPVDWYEWGEDAFEKAIREDKPILVSIGYSSCHWCHVMERESFEDKDIAHIMNEFFVCIKVDREERPDVDQIYMEAVQAMGMNGGWPLNVFLTPEQKPFYGGTYFPPQQWAQTLTSIHKTYAANKEKIKASAEEVSNILSLSDLERFKQKAQASELNHDLGEIYEKLSPKFDNTWGGMDKAPKFVMPSTWLMLLRYYHLTKNDSALNQIKLTLKRIAMGGIHDQVGGGFARYSVDSYWFAPHFEKMLYDNAQLMSLYSEAYMLTKDEEFKKVVEDIFSWLTREMADPRGGFYSALDADSEGVEGKFYVWTKQELDSLLGDDSNNISEYFSVKDTGNWEQGSNIFIRQQTDETFLNKNKISADDWQKTLEIAKLKLLNARERRIRPGLDDKIITSWNAMMITGLVDAYRSLGEDKFLEAAKKNMHFLEQELIKGQTIFRSFKGKASTAKGFLDDYAFVIQAYVNLYQVTFEEPYLEKAEALMEFSLDRFFDKKEEFFFYTNDANEKLITRKKEIFDNVIPASNSVMARNLLYLGTIWDKEQWKKLSSEMSQSIASLILSEPTYMSNWAIALMETKHDMAEVAIMGDQATVLRKELQTQYHPFMITMGAASKSSLPLLLGKEPLDKQTTIYVCFNKTCKLPVHSVTEAEKQLENH